MGLSFSAEAALFWVQRLLAFSLLVQALEIFLIRDRLSPNGPWNWGTLKKEFSFFPKSFQALFNRFFDFPGFQFILWIQIILSSLLLFIDHPVILPFLLLTVLLILFRFRGSFNGGSDSLTVLVLVSVTLGSLFKGSEWILRGSLWFIAIHAVFSYFLSGLSKMQKKEWWKGEALSDFLTLSHYSVPECLKKFSQNKRGLQIFSWMVILFESSFPLALLGPRNCFFYMSLGIAFHLANVYAFGLNRFLWAWLASYPALYFCSHYFS